MPPLVSVVLPAFDAAATVEEAIASVVGQEYTPIEVLVVDDGSTDDTAARAAAFGEPVRVLSIPHSGAAAARNAALAAAHGELIAFLDADDVWLPGKLAAQVRLLDEHPEADATYCAVRSAADGSVRSPDPDVPGADVVRALLLRPSAVFASQSAMLVRRTVLDAVGGYDRSLAGVEDLDYMLRLGLVARFHPSPEVLVEYRPRPQGRSEQLIAVAEGTVQSLNKFFALDPPPALRRLRRRALGTHAMVFAGMFSRHGDLGRAFRWALRALLWHPPTVVRLLGFPFRQLKRPDR
jgi:glycosyltransferase involved in cell wall biosynthesis